MIKHFATPPGHWQHHLEGVEVHQGVKCGNLIFVAGQVAFDPQGNLLFPYDLERQTRICMENIQRVLCGVQGHTGGCSDGEDLLRRHRAGSRLDALDQSSPRVSRKPDAPINRYSGADPHLPRFDDGD